MELRRFIDRFGDDVYALALIVTKSFDSAKAVFAQTSGECGALSNDASLFDVLKAAFPIVKASEVNDEAVILSGIDFPHKTEALVCKVLSKTWIVRAIIHLSYENDLSPKQIAQLVGESEHYVSRQLSELPEALCAELDKNYKTACTKIRADDALKEYVVRSSERKTRNEFAPEEPAVPRHSWSKKQKAVVISIAAAFGILVGIVIPVVQQYQQMREEENYESFENLPDELRFTQTTEQTDETSVEE